MLKIKEGKSRLTVDDEIMISICRRILPDCDSVADFHKELIQVGQHLLRKDKTENLYNVTEEAGTLTIWHLSPGGKAARAVITISDN